MTNFLQNDRKTKLSQQKQLLVDHYLRGCLEAAMSRNRFQTDNLRRRASHITARRVGSHGALEKPYKSVIVLRCRCMRTNLGLVAGARTNLGLVAGAPKCVCVRRRRILNYH